MKRYKCPICGEKIFVALVEELTDNYNPGKYVDKVSSRCNVPYTIPCQNGIVVKYHYENVRVDEKDPYYENDPYWEEFVVFPYIVYITKWTDGSSTMDVHKYDNTYILRHAIQMTTVDLPWHDPDKVRNKLKTMLVFS